MALPVDHVVDYEYMVQWDSSYVPYENLTLPLGCWRYRGEGNANIVIALKNEATIIRLSKHYNAVPWAEKQWKRKVERQVVFTKHIFTPLLGESFVAQVKAVHIPADQITRLNDCLGRIRPRHRMQKELKVPYATAHNDFARILKFSSDDVDYCIEIKPKKGWCLKPICEDGRPELCTYCLNQYLKLKKSKISARSNYCPLDLFSGDPARTVFAVISLLANPQNNLRIFRDGSLVYGDSVRNGNSSSLQMVLEEWMSGCIPDISSISSDLGCVKNLIYLICVALLKPQQDCDKGTQRFLHLKEELREIIRRDILVEKLDEIIFLRSHSFDKKCETDSQELPTGSVLAKVLAAQRLEEPESKYRKKLLNLFNSVCPVHSDVNSSDTEIISDSSREECPSKKCMSGEAWLDEVQSNRLHPKELQCIQRHLLAATVKDCSIMLTFSPVSSLSCDWSVENGGSILQDLQGRLHYSKVGIVDLDPKPLSALVKHYIREPEMLQAYFDLVEKSE